MTKNETLLSQDGELFTGVLLTVKVQKDNNFIAGFVYYLEGKRLSEKEFKEKFPLFFSNFIDIISVGLQ